MLSYTKQPPSAVFYCQISDPVVGRILLGYTQDGRLCRLAFMKSATQKDILGEWGSEWPESRFQRKAGPAPKRLSPKTKIHLVGTAFQYEVWKGLLTIPAGETISYGELAKRINRPKAVRAVGTALGKNPVPLILPCHRVIASDGSIGGFGSGVKLKKKMLKSENETIKLC